MKDINQKAYEAMMECRPFKQGITEVVVKTNDYRFMLLKGRMMVEINKDGDREIRIFPYRHGNNSTPIKRIEPFGLKLEYRGHWGFKDSNTNDFISQGHKIGHIQ